jgi:hypothetical protein
VPDRAAGVSTVPQLRQKFMPGGFSVPHRGHTVVPAALPGNPPAGLGV